MAEEDRYSRAFADIAASRFELVEAAVAQPLCGQTLRRRVQAAAAWLRAHGMRPGDVVACVGAQGASAWVHFWAATLLGGVFAPLDPGWPPARLAAVLRRMRPRVVVAEAPQPLREAWPGAEAPVLAAGDTPQDALPDTPPPPWPAMPPTAPAAWLLTSGSTGEPKIVVLSRGALLRSAALAVRAFGWQPGERLLNLAEPHTMSGLRNALLAAPLAGMRWHAVPPAQRANLFALVDVLCALQPQRLVTAPLLLRQLNLLGDRLPAEALGGLRALYCTGAELRGAEVQAFHRRHGVPVINYYGLTETVGLCLSQREQGWSPADGSLGWPQDCEARLVDAAGQPLPPGAEDAEGELQLRIPLPMSGYLDDPAATAAMFDGPWLRTGDLARIAADGRVTLVGRAGTFIKTTGTEKVHPGEVEAALEQLPGVAEAAALGVADPSGGERIAALVVPAPGADAALLQPARLAEGVRAALGAARVPSQFRCVPHLPRNAGGKLLRPQLAELLNRD